MIITDLLERNAAAFPDEVALVEINPEQKETRRLSWREFDLVEPNLSAPHYRREISWRVFNEKANRLAPAFRRAASARATAWPFFL